jgi:pathogenesis-related protein 1
MEVRQLIRTAAFLMVAALLTAAPMQNRMLAAHNAVRAELGEPPLAWSPVLARYAQQWADHLASERAFYHRPNPRFGENLFMIEGDNALVPPEEVVRAWAGEARHYNERTNSCRGVCGHYTQIVWRSTREVGCAAARSEGYEVWVCNYNPPGNIIGERPY